MFVSTLLEMTIDLTFVNYVHHSEEMVRIPKLVQLTTVNASFEYCRQLLHD
jgi:hypothetical protein